MNEEDVMNNQCADLVSEARLEPGLAHLLATKAVGEWVPVAELYRVAGRSVEGIKANLLAAWLPAPTGGSDEVIVVFYDTDSLWSMTASYYQAARLREQSPVVAVAG